MKILTLDVRTPADSMMDFVHAWKTGKPEKSAHNRSNAHGAPAFSGGKA